VRPPAGLPQEGARALTRVRSFDVRDQVSSRLGAQREKRGVHGGTRARLRQPTADVIFPFCAFAQGSLTLGTRGQLPVVVAQRDVFQLKHVPGIDPSRSLDRWMEGVRP
jgi:hypothetical protein